MRTKREVQSEQSTPTKAKPVQKVDALQHPVSESGPDFRLERITNWRAFGLPEVQKALYHWKPYTDVEAWTELVRKVTEDTAAVWATGVGDEITGLGIVLLPDSAIWPWPYIAHVHVIEGAHRDTRKSLLDAGIAFLKSKGYTHCWAINAAGTPDAAWVRAFRRGGRIVKLGSVFQITLW